MKIKPNISGDLYEIFSIAYQPMANTSTTPVAISNEFKNLKDYLNKVHDIPDSCFKDFKRIIFITNTIIQESIELNQNLEQQYQAEYKESHA